jgi:hypothetical protein
MTKIMNARIHSTNHKAFMISIIVAKTPRPSALVAVRVREILKMVPDIPRSLITGAKLGEEMKLLLKRKYLPWEAKLPFDQFLISIKFSSKIIGKD